tara:strand:- start:248 stop:439 length:192 start_codon:yes stop_codon:yes gene_type:complete
MKHHAAKLFPIALDRLIEIGEKGMKQREQGERAGRVARPRETRACMHVEKQAKQLQLQLQTRI